MIIFYIDRQVKTKPKFYVLLLSLCFFGGAEAQAQVYNYALVPKDLSSAFQNGVKLIEQKQYDDGFASLDQALVLTWSYKILDLPAYSAELIRLCQRTRPERPVEEKLLKYSIHFSPHSSEMAFARAHYFFSAGHFSLVSARAELDRGIKLLEFDLPARLRIKAGFWILLGRFFETAIMALSIIIIIRYQRVLRHGLKHMLPAALEKLATPLVLVVGLIPVYLAGPLWAVLLWPGILCLPFAKRSFQVAFLISLVCFCLSGSLSQYGRSFIIPLSKSAVISEYHMSVGLPDSEDLNVLRSWVEKSPTPAAVLGLADAERRVGDFNKSSALLQKLAQDPESSVFANNLLAEVYLESGQTAEASGLIAAAVNSLEKAAESPQQFAEVYFNLSQLYSIQRRFDQSDSAYQKARQVDEDSVARLDLVKKLANSSLVIARLPIPASLIEKEISPGPDKTKVLPGVVTEIYQLALFVIALLLVIVMGLKNTTKTCYYCGRTICPECLPESRESGVCNPCFQVFKSGKAVDPKLKTEQKSMVRGYHRMADLSGLGLSVLFPGTGLMLGEKAAVGLVLLLWPLAFWTLVLSGSQAPAPLVPVFALWPAWLLPGLIVYAVLAVISCLLYLVLARVET